MHGMDNIKSFYQSSKKHCLISDFWTVVLFKLEINIWKEKYFNLWIIYRDWGFLIKALKQYVFYRLIHSSQLKVRIPLTFNVY